MFYIQWALQIDKKYIKVWKLTASLQKLSCILNSSKNEHKKSIVGSERWYFPKMSFVIIFHAFVLLSHEWSLLLKYIFFRTGTFNRQWRRPSLYQTFFWPLLWKCGHFKFNQAVDFRKSLCMCSLWDHLQLGTKFSRLKSTPPKVNKMSPILPPKR